MRMVSGDLLGALPQAGSGGLGVSYAQLCVVARRSEERRRGRCYVSGPGEVPPQLQPRVEFLSREIRGRKGSESGTSRNGSEKKENDEFHEQTLGERILGWLWS
jgi:hypothetical protein